MTRAHTRLSQTHLVYRLQSTHHTMNSFDLSTQHFEQSMRSGSTSKRRRHQPEQTSQLGSVRTAPVRKKEDLCWSAKQCKYYEDPNPGFLCDLLLESCWLFCFLCIVSINPPTCSSPILLIYWGDTRHWLTLLRPRPAECYQGAWLVLGKNDDRAVAGFHFLIQTWGVETVIKEAGRHSYGNNYKSLTEDIETYAAKHMLD